MKNEKIYFHYGTAENAKLIVQTDIEKIYERLADNESKRIFADRLLFSLTNNWDFIRDMLIETGNWLHLDKAEKSQNNIPAYIYGAGISGSRLPLIFSDYCWTGYIDKNKQGQLCNGLPIYGMEKCKDLSDEAVIVISNMTRSEEIRKEILKTGVSQENIISFADCTKNAARNIYFEEDCLNRERLKGKAFVDAGAFDGADTIHFFNWVDESDASAVVFEADSDNFEALKKNLSQYSNVKLYNQGLSDKMEQHFFSSGRGEMSSFSVTGDKKVFMNSLDNMLRDTEIGYIKMDIEGYERQALLGAKEIISEQHPVLGISIYHKREDIWELPKLILDMNPEYKFFLRHYSLGVVDTVLYAV